MSKQRMVVLSDNGESWLLNGDADKGSNKDQALPGLLEDGWEVQSTTTGSGSKDDSSYWLVLVSK